MAGYKQVEDLKDWDFHPEHGARAFASCYAAPGFLPEHERIWLTRSSCAELFDPGNPIPEPRTPSIPAAILGTAEIVRMELPDGEAWCATTFEWHPVDDWTYVEVAFAREGDVDWLAHERTVWCAILPNGKWTPLVVSGDPEPDRELVLDEGRMSSLVAFIHAVWDLIDRERTRSRVIHPKGKRKLDPRHRPSERRVWRSALQVDARPVRGGPSTESDAGAPSHRGPVDHRWTVSGHFRNQRCGPGLSETKTVWIAPHTAGAPNGPLIGRSARVKVVRGDAAYRS